MKTRILSILLLVFLPFYLQNCILGDLDWDSSNSSDPVINKPPPEILEYSIIVDSITAISDSTIKVGFTIHPYDNIRIDKIYISVSSIEKDNPDNYILLYRKQYVNFETTDCIVPSFKYSTIQPLFLKQDIPIKCCVQLDNLYPNTEYWLFISSNVRSEWPSECVDCTHHPFQI